MAKYLQNFAKSGHTAFGYNVWGSICTIQFGFDAYMSRFFNEQFPAALIYFCFFQTNITIFIAI